MGTTRLPGRTSPVLSSILPMTTRSFPPIAHDKTREAVDSLRGYSYQILRSIEVWIELGDEEALVLEGAEDLDRLSNGAAIVEQVKDTVGSGSITLRTPAVLEAINHAWAHATANSGVTLSFRYLTTSLIGQERGNPLELDLPGLSAWQVIRSAPCVPQSRDAARKIVDFLVQQDGLDEALRAFLVTAPLELAIEKVFVPIDWIVGEGDIDALRGRIEQALIRIGASRSDSVHDSKQALGALHVEAWKRVVEKNRKPFTRTDFLTVFEGATRTAVPNSQLISLISAAFGSPTDQQVVSVSSPGLEVEAVPPLPPRYHRRSALEGALIAQLQTGNVFIQGGTGMGKTSLVAVIAANAPHAVWISLRDVGAAQINARLKALTAFLAVRQTPPVVVLDDLDPGSDPRLLETAAAALAWTVAGLRGMIVVTGAHDLPSRLSRALDISGGRTTRMPNFDQDEIEAYLAALGCPEMLIERWAKLVKLGTTGHPQLVHARLDALRTDQFPRPTQSDLIEMPQAVLDVRAEARHLVGLLAADQRELLLRASLETGRLSREQLIRIARIEQPIADPGMVVDRLVGAWLEFADGGAFRVSPLVRDAAPAIRGMDWVRDMHLSLAWIAIEGRTIDASIFANLLLHVTIARRAAPLVQLLPSLFAAEEKIWEQIATSCDIYIHVGTGTATGAVFDDPADMMLFRLFQLRIAAIKNAAAIDEIIERSDAEWADLPTDPRLEFFRFLFLSQTLSKAFERLSLNQILSYGLEFARLGKKVAAHRPDLSEPIDPLFQGEEGTADFSSFLILPMSTAVKSYEDVEHLLARIADMPDPDARMILTALGAEPVGAGLNTDRLWLHEATSGRKDWQGLSSVLKHAFRKAVTFRIPALVDAIAPLLVRIADEDRKDPAEAISLAGELRPDLTATAPLDCALAKVMWRKRDFEPALALYEDALPRWESGRENLDLASAYRDAGMAAGKAGQWRLAAARFATGARLLPQTRMVGRRVGLIFDEGHALAMAGDADDALGALARGVSELEPLEPISETEPMLSTQKRAGALLQALIEWREGAKTRAEIEEFVGVCSIVDPIASEEMAPTPTDFIVYNLLRVEHLMTASAALAARYAGRLRATPYVLLRGVAPLFLMRAMEETDDFGPLVEDLVQQARSMAAAKLIQEGEGDFRAKVDSTISVAAVPAFFGLARLQITVAMFHMAANDKIRPETFDRWMADAPEGSQWDPLRCLVVEIHRLFTGSDDIWVSVRKPMVGETEHVLAALAAICCRTLTAEQVLICHGLWAHYLRDPERHRSLEPYVARLVVSRWLGICQAPLLLVAPRLTIPAIQAAALGSEAGWSKVKAVLVAALDAVDRHAADTVRAPILAIEA